MHMFEMRQLHWYHMQGRWVYTIKSCRSFPESFRHIIFAFRDLLERSGMVKPCQAMWSHVSLPRREILVLCTCCCSKRHFRVGSTGDRRVRGHQERSSVNHGNSWEAWSRANLLHSVESASFLPWRYCIQFRPTFEATLTLSDSFARMEGFMVFMSKKNDKNEIQIDTILPCHANHFLSTIQMSPFDLHLRWIPSKRLLVVGQHWLWQRTGGWAVIHGALEIDGTGPKFGSEMIFYR